jgi:phosphoglycolate phosphatase
MYDSLVLDHDGVLVDVMPRDVRQRAFRRHARTVFTENGIEPDDDAIDTLEYSVSHDELLALSERLGTTPEQLWRARDDTLATVLREAARDGHKEPYADVDELSNLSAPLGIVSNNQRRIVEHILEEYGLRDQFGSIHARPPRMTSLTDKKPSPTYLERAMDDLDVSNPLYVGDKVTDVQAGQRAGLDVAFLRREHNADEPLDADPTYEVSGLDKVVSLVE